MFSHSRQEALALIRKEGRGRVRDNNGWGEGAISRLIKAGSEDAAQAEVIQWARDNEHRWPELVLLHAIPNGGNLSKPQRAVMAHTGLLSGIPDLDLPVPRGRWHGLRIEMKHEPYRAAPKKPGTLGQMRRGTVSAEQKKIIALLREQGYRVEVCEGPAPAIELLEQYLKS